MSGSNAFLHLTLEERRIILKGIENGSTKTAIAKTIGKDNSTVGKEIKLHRVLRSKCGLPIECSNYRRCPYGRNCTTDCPDLHPFHCSRRDRSPGACNGCSNWSHCRFNKYLYVPEQADKEYREILVESRQGVNLTTSEAREIASIVEPLLKQGLSPYQILQMHPEIHISEKTLYNYIEQDVFHELSNISVLDLRRQASRKLPKKRARLYRKREDRKYLRGRTYKDFQSYVAANPNAFITQMDTLYNNESEGPFLQTFKFLNSGVLFALYHSSKTSLEMVHGMNTLEEILGWNVFIKYVHILLTDRGPEFSNPDALEFSSTGLRRTRVFYCDPMRAGQKGSLENKHIELRYILPRQTDLTALGLTDQKALNLALCHINSAPQEKLGGKSPLEVAEFMYSDLYESLLRFGLKKLDKNNIILKPYLLKK